MQGVRLTGERGGLRALVGYPGIRKPDRVRAHLSGDRGHFADHTGGIDAAGEKGAIGNLRLKVTFHGFGEQFFQLPEGVLFRDRDGRPTPKAEDAAF